METLEETYLKIANCPNIWSYYPNPLISINEAWKDADRAYSFIKSYFSLGGKDGVFNDYNIYENVDYIISRAQHIISTFLLGLKIAKCFDIDIQKRDIENMNFKYYWFLTCLYHDIGYAYEDMHNYEWLEHTQKNGLEAIKSICGIKYMNNGIFRTYSKEQVDFYLKIRAENSKDEIGKLDHGIVGGMLLYDRLRKQFDYAFKNRTDKNDGRSQFYIKRDHLGYCLNLSNKHYKSYAKVADAIISHNIWISTFNEYINTHKLSNMTSINKKITIKNSLCYILSIADSIEPFKCGIALSDIEIIKSRCGFKISLDKILFKKIQRKVEELETWLQVHTNITEKNRKIFIEIQSY